MEPSNCASRAPQQTSGLGSIMIRIIIVRSSLPVNNFVDHTHQQLQLCESHKHLL
jgi:hypothetical protein